MFHGDTTELQIMCGLGNKRKKGKVEKGEGGKGLYIWEQNFQEQKSWISNGINKSYSCKYESGDS